MFTCSLRPSWSKTSRESDEQARRRGHQRQRQSQAQWRRSRRAWNSVLQQTGPDDGTSLHT